MSESNVLEVGTEVSAKYRGAFCEATIKHVKKLIKIRLSWNKPLTGSATLTQDNVRGVIKVQHTVEAKKDNIWCAGTVLKITDASTYTVVFDDGDERTLGRNSVCPQGAKHFNEEWTLDHLPLTNPEIFGTPVILETKKQRKRRKIDGPAIGRSLHYSEEDVGKVAFYDTRSKKQTLQPVLIACHSQCDEFISTNPGEVIVRSFKSGKFMSIPKEDMVRFDRDTEPLQSILNNTTDITVMKPALEKALAFYDTGVLPVSWENTTDSHVRLKEPDDLNDGKLKKQFTAGIYDFWEKKGSPITRQPSVGYHDLDLYHLYCYVTEYGGPDNVSKDMKWRSICAQMNILNIPPSGSHTVKNAYCRHVVPFLEEWQNRGKRRRSTPPQTENIEDTPVTSKKKGRVCTTPMPSSKGRRTSTPTPGCGRRNSVKLEENDSVSSDTTDYDNMPDVHKYSIGARVKVLYGAPKHCGSYEAKINERNIDSRSDAPVYHIHYTGWNIRYDEWVTEDSIISLVTRSSKKKGTILDPPKDIKVIPNRRKIIPKYRKSLKKQLSNTSETSSADDKNSLPASETSETEDSVVETKQLEVCPVKLEETEEVSAPPAPPSTPPTTPTSTHPTIKEVEEPASSPHYVTSTSQPATSSSQPATSSSQEAAVECPVTLGTVTLGTVTLGTVTLGTSLRDTRDDKSPLLCEENFDDIIDTSVSSSQPVHYTIVKEEEDKAKEEAAAILMTFPNTFPIKPLPSTTTVLPSHPHVISQHPHVTSQHPHVTSQHPHVISQHPHVTSQHPHVISQHPHVTSHHASLPNNLHYAYHLPPGPKNLVHRLPLSPSKHLYITTSNMTSACPTSSGCPTQYMTTNTIRPVVTAASIAKIPPQPLYIHKSSNNRLLTKPGSVMVVPPTQATHRDMTEAMQGNFNTLIKQRFKCEDTLEDSNEKKKGRKRKIQQADSTSDIGSRLQQFEFRPDPCEDCDKRADERPKRAERDKARRGTVKNSDCSKLSSGERTVQQPPYWVPGSVVGSNYVRSSTVPLYYTGADIIQGGYYVPMRPPGIGPYPPGYTPKFPIPIPKSQPGDQNKEATSKTTEPSTSSQLPTSSIREPISTCAEPDSTTEQDTTLPVSTPPHHPPYTTPPYTTPPYTTPPYSLHTKLKGTPNLDSDSSDEKTTVPGMSPLLLTHSMSDTPRDMSECSDKEQPSSSKVKIFDKDFGIHLFDHLELPDKIKSMQSTMGELQKCYLFYKGQITRIEKKEREKRKSKKRRKSKQRTSSLSAGSVTKCTSSLSAGSVTKCAGSLSAGSITKCTGSLSAGSVTKCTSSISKCDKVSSDSTPKS